VSQSSTSGSEPTSITSGPDGNLWFTEQAGNQIGRITTSGTVTEFPIPTANSQPVGITSGPDGNLWFTEQAGNQIGRITTSGAITQYPTSPVSLMANAEPSDIVEGPDGNLWFTETNVSQIGALIFPVTSSSSGSNSGTPSGASLTGKVPKSPDTGFAMYRGNQTGIVLILTSMLFMAILLFYRFRHNKKTADIYR
jgi:virginiamycin B lyase